MQAARYGLATSPCGCHVIWLSLCPRFEWQVCLSLIYLSHSLTTSFSTVSKVFHLFRHLVMYLVSISFSALYSPPFQR
jgi:hypothetical protein